MLYEPNKYSFELNPEMFQLLHDEFDVEKITSRFAEVLNGKGPEEIEAEGKAIFEAYGRDWIKKVHQLGDEYPDRTYEVLKEIIDKSGGFFKFGLLPQRFIEIAYLSVMEISTLPIIENNAERLIYRMVDCLMFNRLKEKCGEEVANLLPCRHACLTACKTIHQDLDIDAIIQMEASMPKDGHCQFAARRA